MPRGVLFHCSTLTPNGGRPASDRSPQAEATRERLNAFYRTPQSGCDGIVDQDTATRDPADMLRCLPEYDSGDHRHPNDDGMQAIADAVDLGLFGSAAAATPSFAPAGR